MKKLLSLSLATLFSLTSLAAVGCGETGEQGGSWNEPVNEGATQLSISNFDGGFGTEWLYVAAKRFEKKYATTSFETGKTGVQIRIDPMKTVASGIIGEMQDSTTEIYFNEQVYYRDAVSEGKFLDITDIVTENLSADHGEDATIESKLTAEQIAFYKTEDGKYYGLPHYGGYCGITYDIDLFENEGYYLAKNKDNGNDGFVKKGSTEERSYGPDGQKGTYDDGLPATYDEFFKLCARISKTGVTPMLWAGMQREGSWVGLLNALFTDYEGLDQMMLNYTCDGEATNLVDSYKVDESGRITEINLKSETVTPATGYKLSGQAGRAYALSFLERLLKGNYYSDDATDESISNVEGQLTYLESSLIGEPIAMYVDGSFWFNEADSAFDLLYETYGEKAKAENRRFGFMPMPKADSSRLGKQTMMDYLYSAAFINANIAPEKAEVAKLFLQFLYTDESLIEFTVITNTPKAVTYELGDSYDQLTEFGKSVWDNKLNADLVYPYTTNKLYLNNQSKFNMYYRWYSKIGTSTKNMVFDSLRKEKVAASDYFSGIQNYYNETYWNNNFGAYFD